MGRFVIACAHGAVVLGVALSCRGPRPAPPRTTAPDTDARPAPAATEVLGLEGGAAIHLAGSATGESGTASAATELTVVDEIAHGGQTAWLVRGWPAASVWGPYDGLAVVVRRGDAYHQGLVPPEREAAARRALARGELPADVEPWFKLPLRAGDRVCPSPDAPHRCWTVEADGARFRVSFVTAPDDTTYVIDPARGLVGFEYHHHGTPNDVILERR